MNIAVLITWSLLLMIVSFAYLTKSSFEGDSFAEKIASVVKNNTRTLLYNLGAFVVMSALSVTFIFAYASNTLVGNMKLLCLVALLVTVCVTDIREQIIPNKIILVGIVLRVCFAVAELATLGSAYFDILKRDGFSVLLVGAFFVLGVLIVKNGIGMGDIKLMLIMGLFQGITGVISSIFFSLLVSFFASVILLILKKKTRKDAIEFAPCILLGTTVSMFLTGM